MFLNGSEIIRFQAVVAALSGLGCIIAKIFFVQHHGVTGVPWATISTYVLFNALPLAITPSANLIRNIGFGSDASHTKTDDAVPGQKKETLSFPLRHPPYVLAMRSMDRLDQKIWGCHIPNLAVRAMRKILRMFS